MYILYLSGNLKKNSKLPMSEFKKKKKTALVVMFQQLIFEQVFVLLISASVYDILVKKTKTMICSVCRNI